MQENLSRSKPRWMDEECANWNTTPKTDDLRLNLRRCSDLTLRVNLLHLRAFLTISASCWFLLQILNYIFIQITIQPKSGVIMNVNIKLSKRAFPCIKMEISDLPTGILPRHIVRGSADGSHCSAPQESRGRRCCNLDDSML